MHMDAIYKELKKISIAAAAAIIGILLANYISTAVIQDNQALIEEKGSADMGMGAINVSGSEAGINLKRFGATGDGVTDDASAFNEALKEIGRDDADLFIPKGTYRISKDVVVGKTVSITFANGAIITPDKGVTLYINGEVKAGSSRIFGGEGDIAGSFKNSVIYPQWWGAAGNGVADDHAAIQKALDFCFNSDCMILYFARGTYNISYPLVIKTKVENTSVKWWDGKAVEMVGEDKATTKIVKTTGNVLSGVHDEADNKDSAIICFSGLNYNGTAGGIATGIEIRNLYIVNKSTAKPNAAAGTGPTAITGRASQRARFEDLNIESYSGIIFGEYPIGPISSNFENIVFRCTERALVVSGSCTSNTFRHLFAYGCKNPYKICGGYSGLYLIYADNCTGTIFDVGGPGMVMLNCGTESPKAQYIVKSDYRGGLTKLNILSLMIWRQTGDPDNNIDIADCAVFYGPGNIKVGSLDILDSEKLPSGENSYLFESSIPNSNASFDIDRITYQKNFTGEGENPSLLYCKQRSSASSTGKISVNGSDVNTRSNLYMPYIGIRGMDSLQTGFINKAIYLDNETKTTDSSGNDLKDEQGYHMGDILLINDPASMNILGYSVTSGGGAFVRDGIYKEIPIVLSGTTEERPASNRYKGLQYFDTTLGKPIWWNGTAWVDAAGGPVQ